MDRPLSSINCLADLLYITSKEPLGQLIRKYVFPHRFDTIESPSARVYSGRDKQATLIRR